MTMRRLIWPGMDRTDNILLIRLKSIGDILFLLPAVQRMRENFPESQITFLTARENAGLLKGFPQVNEVVTLDRSRFQGVNVLAMLAEMLALLRKLRRGKFSLAVDFQGYGETAWMTRLAGAPQRWGNLYGSSRRRAYTRGLRRNPQLHHVDWYLSLLEQCGLSGKQIVNKFVLPTEPLEEARRFFDANRLEVGRPTLFIQPFTSSPKKNWPLDRQLTVARYGHQCGWQVLFGGGPSEQAALEPVRRAGFPVAAGTSLLVTGGLMKLSSLVLGGDTGALHLAVALGKQVMMIMDSTTLGNTYPYQHPDWTIAPPSGGNILGIETGAVIAACNRALSESAGNVSC